MFKSIKLFLVVKEKARYYYLKMQNHCQNLIRGCNGCCIGRFRFAVEKSTKIIRCISFIMSTMF